MVGVTVDFHLGFGVKARNSSLSALISVESAHTLRCLWPLEGELHLIINQYLNTQYIILSDFIEYYGRVLANKSEEELDELEVLHLIVSLEHVVHALVLELVLQGDLEPAVGRFDVHHAFRIAAS